MKNIYCFLSILLVMVACNDRLDLQPYGVVSTDNFYRTAADAEYAVTAAYKSFQLLDGQNGGNMLAGYSPTGDALSADVQGHPDIVIYYQLQQCIVRPNSEHLQMLYQRCYKALFLANIAIEKIPAIEMDETLKSRYMGELYFIRGFWMFRLGYIFGTAPVVDKTLELDELNIPNSKRTATVDAAKRVNNTKVTSDLFDQAEADFKEALKYGLADRNTGDLMGRADNGAIKAYLAQVYMYQHRWEEAKKELEDIMSYGYDLIPDYNDLFNGTSDNSLEAVFEVQYTASNQKGTDNFGTVLNAPNAEGYVAGGGWGWTRPTLDIVNEYEDGDPRLVCSLLRKGIDDFYGEVFEDRVNGTGYGIRKWCIGNPPNNNGVTIDLVAWTNSCNYTLVRYAEVLLWYAEVMNELNDPATAARYVNMVRARTATTSNPNTVNVDQYPTQALDPIATNLGYEDMFWAIVHERRIELAFEGKSGWDLRRWGIAKEVLTSAERWQNQVTPGYFQYKENKDELLALPQLEIDRSGGVLEQNIGHER